MSTLVNAVSKRSIEDVCRLLRERANPNSVDKDNNTALHLAVKLELHYLAALLLTNGADWSIRNKEGKQALSLEFTSLSTLHRIRQEYHRFPISPYDVSQQKNKWVKHNLEQLNQDGIVKISQFIKPDVLKRMQSDFSAFVRKMKIGRVFCRKRFIHINQDEYWQPDHKAYVTFDALRYSHDLTYLCSNTNIIELANHYLQKPAKVKRVYGMRYLPSKPIKSSQFIWHHDMEDKQLKLMVLLTDVSDDDQYMVYIRGSHKTFHPYERFLKNALDLDYCKTYLDKIEIVKLTGKAGDIFLFDTNGMHRGCRTKGRIRDTFFIEFTVNKDENVLWGSKLSPDYFPKLFDTAGNSLKDFLTVTPRWQKLYNQDQKINPSLEWVNSLDNPDSWL